MSKIKNISSDSDGIDSDEIPTTGEVRQRLESRLRAGLKEKENVAVRAPTSAGKTHTAATAPWRNYPEITGGEPVILFEPTKDARRSAAKKNSKSEATGQTLLGREDACPVAGGEYDSMDAPDGSAPSDWFRQMCDDRGIPFSVAHDHFKRYHDGEIPCSPCECISQWEEIPRTGEDEPAYDVILATHQFARVPALFKNCNIVIDERPDFRKNVATEDMRRPITSYLQHVNAPVSTLEDLITDHIERDTNRFFQSKFRRPDTNWFLNADDAHVLAPGIVNAILKAQEECHDRWVGETVYRYPDLNPYTNSPEHRVKIRVVFDADYNIRLLQVLPDFGEARSIIGLDAHPTKPKWRGNVLESLTLDRILSEEEERLWRRHERNLEVIQVGSYKYTWTDGGLNKEKVTGLCSELRHQYGTDFCSGITSKQCADALEDCMEAGGVDEPQTIHYGMEKSVERFADETVGLVAGCISPSSDHVKDWLALLGRQATPKREICEGYRGQEWVGPDASVAHKLLADVREKHVLQAAGRYARSPEDPEDSATVYVLTSVLPNSWVDKRVNDIVLLGEKQRQIIKLLYESTDGMTPAEVADEVDASRKHVHETLKQVRESPWYHVETVEGHNNGNLHHAGRNPDCIVEL